VPPGLMPGLAPTGGGGDAGAVVAPNWHGPNAAGSGRHPAYARAVA